MDTLEQFYAMVEQKDKQDVLLDLLEKEKPKSTIIFCRTKYGAHKLARELQRNYINAVPLHGDLSQHQRDHSMGVFRSGHADVLVATDVASRGIDISQVDCVINYDVPEDPVLYFHRVGRTARAGDSGKAFTLVSYEEDTDFARITGPDQGRDQADAARGRGAQLLRQHEGHDNRAPEPETRRRRKEGLQQRLQRPRQGRIQQQRTRQQRQRREQRRLLEGLPMVKCYNCNSVAKVQCGECHAHGLQVALEHHLQ